MAAPKRNAGGKSDKLIRDALMVAVNREVTDENGQKTKRLYVIANKLAEMAEAGDIQAIKEVADRIDGKAHQTAEITHARARAAELTDDVLAGYIPTGSGDGTAEAPEDPQRLH